MKDFDISKYLKENQMGSYGILNHYVDLKPINEINEEPTEEAREEGPFGMPDTDQENPWMEDVDGSQTYQRGKWTCIYEYPGYLAWDHADVPADKLSVAATPNFDNLGKTPVQINIDQEPLNKTLSINKPSFKDFEEYYKAVKPYLDAVELKYVPKMKSNDTSSGIQEVENLGGWDGDDKNDQYDGEYDADHGPAEVNEDSFDGAQFNQDMQSMISHIKGGYNFIEPDYVEQTWGNLSDIPFDAVKDKVMDVLVKARLSNYPEEINEEIDINEYDNLLRAIESLLQDGESPKDILTVVKDTLGIKESSAPVKEALDWEELDYTDVNGSSMEMLIDDAIYEAEKAIESTTERYPEYRHGLLRMKIKQLWLEKIKGWKGLPQGY